MRITFEIPGKPFAKQRPRFANGRAYTPKETVSFERQVASIAAQHFAAPFDGPVRVAVAAVFETPPSWSKRKTQATRWTPHMQKPDLDNIFKAISDGLNRIAFHDDKQIAAFEGSKIWGSDARTVVTVTPLTMEESND